jgi:hypothetical protein
MTTEVDLRQTFDENGYVIIRNAFTEEEIDQIRAATLNSLTKKRNQDSDFTSHKNAAGNEYFSLPELLSISELADLDYVVLHPKITNIVQQLIAGPVCYFGDSTAQIGTGERGFHKDNVDRSNQNGPDWQSNYDVLRLAIYAQDTYSYSGGMQLRLKSHLSANRFHGKPKNIRLKVGDILLWKLTVTHSGNTLLPKLFPNFSRILPRITTHLPKWLFKPYASERVALFMSFGALKSIHTENYRCYLERRSDTLPFYPNEANELLAKNRSITLIPLKS